MTIVEPRTDLVEVARGLRPLIESQAEKVEAEGTLTQTVVDAVADAGLFWIMVPQEQGGSGADIGTCIDVFDELAYADGSTGWSVMANASTSLFAAIYLPDEALAAMFGGSRPHIHAGMLGPVGTAVPTDGGYVVEGSYRFGSGTGHADWFGAGVMEFADGEPALTDTGLPAMKVAFVPRDQVEMIGNWDVMGLAGTGSFDYRINAVTVPEAHTFKILEANALRGGPQFDLGLFGFTASGHAGFALGVGRRALDEIVSIAKTKERLGGESTIGRQQLFQHDFAMHDAAVRAARSYVHDAFGLAEETVLRGEAVSNVDNQRLRQATTWATRVAADACRFAYTWAGSDGLRNPSVVQRCFRDISAATQHIYVDNNTLTGYTQAVLDAS